MFTVTTAAATTDLTTLAAVKLAFGVKRNETADDDFLRAEIARVSRFICSYLRVAMADDGSVNLGVETLVETFRLHKLQGRGGYYAGQSGIAFSGNDEKPVAKLVLARKPVGSIVSITEDGTALTASDYEAESADGMLSRLFADRPRDWCAQKTMVTYTAGWRLPNDRNRNLPQDIEDAAIALMRLNWFSRKRDPLLKMESVPGVRERAEYWVGPVGDGGIPGDICVRLDPYRNMSV